MNDHMLDLAERLLKMTPDTLSARERKVLDHLASRARISEDINKTYHEQMSFGDRLADNVAAFGGSWTFIIIFFAVLLAWVASNVFLMRIGQAFDPYPFIFLNLVLSMIAAVQAPIIMMSQNRQAAKDRLVAGHDYEINLKAELEILALHEKLDDVRQEKLVLLMKQQEEQMKILAQILKSTGKSNG
ncbi:MAG: DUF1003 domain-containing protein [Rhizobiaceae bacterium]